MVAATGATPFCSARANSAASSPAEPYRSPGSLAIARARTASTAGEALGFAARTCGTGALRRATIVAIAEPPENGALPATT
jgi:hypothetical protein